MHLNLNVKDETSKLKTVVLGLPCLESNISLDNTYDAKSFHAMKNDCYPKEKDVEIQISCFEEILKKHGVKIYRPTFIPNCNLVFSRDVAFVIDDIIINSRMIKNRRCEQMAYIDILNNISSNKVVNLPENVSIEGGDVILYKDIIFLGIYRGNDFDNIKTARTNKYALDFLKELFPHRIVIPIELKKNDFDPYKGILHLDCAFMPVSSNNVILHEKSFKCKKDYYAVLDIFGENKTFCIDENEAVSLYSNIFSISPNIIVSDVTFTRLNSFLEDEWGLAIEKISYSEISKMGGLFRCSTLPLEREFDYV